MRWPSGYASAPIPLAPDHFVDRASWEDVAIQRISSGRPDTLLCDQFQGRAASPQQQAASDLGMALIDPRGLSWRLLSLGASLAD